MPQPENADAAALTVEVPKQDAMDLDAQNSLLISSSPKVGVSIAGCSSPKLSSAQRVAQKKAQSLALKRMRKVRTRQIEALAELKLELDDASLTSAEKLQRRLDFLNRQAEVFTHGRRGVKDGRKNKKGGKRTPTPLPGGRRNRKSEEAEDKEMMDRDEDDDFTVTRVTQQPPSIAGGQMRDYQIEGLNWLINLHIKGINGILADEMGLGKTLQSISILTYIHDIYGIEGKHIIVVPKSTIGNWCREFKRWAPVFRVLRFLGSKPERVGLKQQLAAGEWDVVVTSYEMIKIEKGAFTKWEYMYMVLDEAHSIKNENSALSKTVRLFNVQSRLLLTGTPLQNNLHELWSLLNFLLPDIFGSSDDFDSWFQFDNDTESEMEGGVVKKLHTILRPFLLRRLKNDVEDSLLPKIETKLYIGMSEMQKYWYKQILTKDATQLNQLGGAGKVKLLNILMQLRKCCNHPYLFNGAEIGPPYTNGPHLWENAGKMVLLERLLPKLKKQGSRVLLFSQMTRVLDIMEDYMAIKKYNYCRIDGNTKAELRDSQMDDFNRPDSDKFLFMLSTRAGGLGINLQTADIVILFDSDWNPQVDLQAMDRAHRIGQKKQVYVFRFVTENSVEEKIIERAERKLYLDAVVIQQGRLMQQNKKLSKEEMQAMVKFGADQIFQSSESSITDADIDALLATGQKRTAEFNTKIRTDMKNTLNNFSLDTTQEKSIYDYEADAFADEAGGDDAPHKTFINLPQRQRKRNYDVNEYFRETMASGKEVSSGPREKKPKSIPMYDYQFFEQDKIKELFQKEFDLDQKKRTQQQTIRDLQHRETRERRKAKQNPEALQRAEELKAEAGALIAGLSEFELSAKDFKERESLIEAGFSGWNKGDFRKFVVACERHGRKAKRAVLLDVANATGKPEAEVKRYFKVFWARHEELSDSRKVIEKIKRGEQKIARRLEIERTIAEKVQKFEDPFLTLTIEYGSSRGKSFTEEEDRFLICSMARVGYGKWDRLKMEIRNAWQFRFDWFIKSRTPQEIQRRCETLVRLLDKEKALVEKGKSSKKRGKESAPSSAKKRKKSK